MQLKFLRAGNSDLSSLTLCACVQATGAVPRSAGEIIPPVLRDEDGPRAPWPSLCCRQVRTPFLLSTGIQLHNFINQKSALYGPDPLFPTKYKKFVYIFLFFLGSLVGWLPYSESCP